MAYSGKFLEEITDVLMTRAPTLVAYLQTHPGSNANDIAYGLEITHRETSQILRRLVTTGDIIRVKRNNHRGIRYYLPGQELNPTDAEADQTINQQIIDTADRILTRRAGAGVKARDILYAFQDAGMTNPPNTYKIAAVLKANGYVLDPERSRYCAMYVHPQETW